MRNKCCIRLLVLGSAIVWWANGPSSWSADIESFDFNDATGTPLDMAANTANPTNQWFADPDMAPSQVAQNVDGRPGSYYILKSGSGSDNNFLQIADVTSGTRYLTAKIAGWDFEEAEQEQFRLAFLNSDTEPNFGNLITAQVSLVRGTDGTVELTGGALGPGSASIVSDVKFPGVHTSAFEMTLALDRTANKYKVFYRDAGGPTQVLGVGYIDPTRDGKAIRMQATGNYANFVSAFPGTYQNDYIDFFALDRVALTDTNPHSDLITLEIDRDNGAMTLRNTSGSAINGIESYSIESAAGGLNPANWTPIAGGTNSSSNALLMQSFAAAINLTNGQSIPLSNASGAWLKSPLEDLTMVLNLTVGGPRTVNVNFIDNGGLRWATGDLNYDGSITAADYTILATNAETNLAGLSRAEAYRKGDLGGDGSNSLPDFAQFKSIYEAANGAGSFDVMLASVPEPSSLLLLGFAATALVLGRRRNPEPQSRDPFPVSTASIFANDLPGVDNMPRARNLSSVIIVLAALVAGASTSQATILEDFMFNEPNGTVLGDTENSANPANSWLVHSNTVESATFNGSFRINKQSQTNQASNALEIANITTGKVWLVAEIAGWSYTGTASTPSERVRLAFMDNDPASTGGSFVTAQANIDRGGSGIVIAGEALGGGTTVAASSEFNLVRATPLSIALELNKNVNQYTIYYKDNANPYQTLGTGNLGSSSLHSGSRDGNSVRFAFTGTFGDAGEYFDVNRMYLTDTDPTGGAVGPQALSLVVQSNGMVFLKNETAAPISFDSYRIASGSNSLNFSSWSSLHDLGIDPFMGGNDPGELWTESGGSSDAVLAESFLLSASTLAPGASFSLGNAFKVGGVQDLTFQYHDSVSLALPSVIPTYVTVAAVAGDYNQDGTVNAADYTIWRDTLGSITDLRANGDNSGASANKIDQADYAFWKSRFGMTSGAGAGVGSLSAVPEPGLWAMALVLAGSALLTRRHSRS